MGAGGWKMKFKNLSRRDWRALSFCILLAATIWLLRALNKESTALIQVSVKVANGLPAGYELVPSTVEVELEASGFLLLRTKYFKKSKSLIIEPCSPDFSSKRCATYALDYERDLRKIVGGDRTILKVKPDSVILLRKPESLPQR